MAVADPRFGKILGDTKRILRFVELIKVISVFKGFGRFGIF